MIFNHDGVISLRFPEIPEKRFFSDASLVVRDFPVFAKDIAAPGATKYTSAQVESMIVNGKEVANKILHQPDYLIDNRTSAREVQNLVWFLTASACEDIGSSFNRGVIRLTPLSQDQSTRLRTFFSNCKEANAHNRPSSHFKEITIGNQKGLDFDKGSLPFDQDLSTVLCGRLNDDSFFVKFEREGLSLTTPLASVRHIGHWVSHITSGGGHGTVGGKETRRETDGQEKLKMAFEKTISALGLRGKAKRSEISTHSRIFQMFERVDELKNRLDDIRINRTEKGGFKGRRIANLQRAINEFYEVALTIPDVRILSGREVLLDIEKYLLP